MTHLMIDIETLGNVPGCPIVSMAAVPFTIDRDIAQPDPLLFMFDVNEQMNKGLLPDSSTIAWWLAQSDAARNELISCINGGAYGYISMEENMGAFIGLIKSIDGCLISKGAGFDLAILRYYFKAHNQPTPWRYTKERCQRTYESLLPSYLVRGIQDRMSGTKHSPLHDCNVQIEILRNVCEMFKWDDIK